MPSETVSMNNFSDISGMYLLAGMVRLRAACARRGRLSYDASCSVSLPWTRHPNRNGLFPLSLPAPQPLLALAGGHEHIDPCPDFSGRTTMEMLMGPEVIVDRPRVSQRPVERGGILDGMRQQHPLHRADEPLDAAVLPRASRIAVLQANAHQSQHHRKTPRREDGFVIGAQESRAAILTARGSEVAPDRQRRFIRQSLHAQAGAARMVQDGQYDMLAAVGIGFCQQVHAPDQITGNGTGHPMFQCSPYTEDRILLSSDRVGHVSFTDRHAAAFGEATIKAVRDRAAARLRHQRFQSDDLIPHPFGFGMGTDAPRRSDGTALSPTQMVGTRPQPGLDQMPQSDQPQDQKSEPHAHDCLVVGVVRSVRRIAQGAES